MSVEKEDLLVKSFIESLFNTNLQIVDPPVLLDPLYNSIFSIPEKKYFKNLGLCKMIEKETKG